MKCVENIDDKAKALREEQDQLLNELEQLFIAITHPKDFETQFEDIWRNNEIHERLGEISLELEKLSKTNRNLQTSPK
jgi:hypothetical protein